ncbi:MAG: hypothetical protein CM1200mP10_18830 [Candidatus Neomarinimicrobiota bacterium]|nr:MAG: hypothetical protein CM1200mP10_18830 [Candidatus Neomarinimicrobiota bacterium]
MACSGHEAPISSANTLDAGKDWSYPYYRDGAFP